MKKYIIYLGLNDKTTKTQLLPKNDAIAITNMFLEGATFTDATGLWLGDIENTLKIEALYTSDDVITDLCKALKTHYNQECVMYTVESVEIVNV